MQIVGYHIKQQIDRGDAWLNAVDPQYVESTMHKECAWNCNALEDINNDPEIIEFDKITMEQATGLTCGYCEHPLSEKQQYAFQVKYECHCCSTLTSHGEWVEQYWLCYDCIK